MIHIRVDDERENAKARFACGLTGKLPAGDQYYFAGELSARRADCPGCNPGGPYQPGVPISELSGNAMLGGPKWERFKAIAASYGYD